MWKKKTVWTIEKSFEEAKKFKFRSEFKKEANRAYQVLCKNKLLEEACSHMKRKKSKLTWTKEECIKAAKKCKSRSEFQNKYSGAYASMKRHGWENDILKILPILGNRYHRCIYACEFSDNHVYVGLTFNYEKRIKQHLRDKKSAVFQHLAVCKNYIFKKLTEYINYNLASIKESEFEEYYKNNGWVSLNRCKTGGLGSNKPGFIRKWTKNKCLELFEICKTYNEYVKNYPGAINYAMRNNFIEEIKKHYNVKKREDWSEEKCINLLSSCTSISDYQKKYVGAYNFLYKNKKLFILRNYYQPQQRGAWSFNEIYELAKKYKTKKEFREDRPGTYNVAKRNGWLDKVCEHMSSSRVPIYNNENVIECLNKHLNLNELKQSDNSFERGCYWWLKSHKLIQEYKKYLKKM